MAGRQRPNRSGMKANAPRIQPPRSVSRFAPTPGGALVLRRDCACGGSDFEGRGGGARVPAQLSVGAPDDAFEREADRVADQIAAAPARAVSADPPARVQRAIGAPTGDAMTAPASVDHALATAGEPLEPVLRQDMEQRFGHDFSRVRVHFDAVADRSARDVNANAYAVGHHIAFAAGRYAPATRDGRRLIAHELTHVVQQSGAHAGVQRDDKKKAAQAPKVVAPVAPTPGQQKMIDAARRAAAIRAQTAGFKARGVEGSSAFQEARRLAQIKFDWPDPNMDQIGEIVGGMGGGLVTVDVKVAGAGDPDCGDRSGYVRGHRPPIVLCPAFFKNPADNEGRIRTMIHEMAHVKGIGKADVAEQYIIIFDCTSKGAFESADAWANYVHCLSGQTPDKEEITGKPGKAPGAGGKSAPKKEGAGK